MGRRSNADARARRVRWGREVSKDAAPPAAERAIRIAGSFESMTLPWKMPKS